MIEEIPPRAQPPPAAHIPWLVRLRRSPLRRPTDLLQAWVGLALTLAVLAGVPLAMLLVGNAVDHSLQQAAKDHTRANHRTTAVLLHPAPHHLEPGSDEEKATRYPVEVRFTDTNGRTRTGETKVRPGLPAKSTVQLWINGNGELTDPPMAAGEIRSRAMGWAGLAGAGVALTGVAAYATVNRVLNRRRLADWERAWADTAPRWSR
ncbi:Rv1733c family protein [Streptomyces violens]|uniref:Rv1733c family protein n=1 Tax=Streptomyces violens TaxID=66377 RepID=UPI0004C116B6|nr:hypothetical protein [Streptomyces violens]